jgi:hypothetical protein
MRQWCRRNVHDRKSCWQKGQLDTELSSSHVMTDCSTSFRVFFWPVRLVTPSIEPLDVTSGQSANSLVSFVNRFSNLDTSSFCRSTRFFRRFVNMAVWSLDSPLWSLYPSLDL